MRQADIQGGLAEFAGLFRQAERGEAGDGNQRALAAVQAGPEPNFAIAVLNRGGVQRAGHRIVGRGVAQTGTGAVQRVHQFGAAVGKFFQRNVLGGSAGNGMSRSARISASSGRVSSALEKPA